MFDNEVRSCYVLLNSLLNKNFVPIVILNVVFLLCKYCFFLPNNSGLISYK